MKDCSFGGRYPVAGLLVIEKNTGKYGLKLGCHPDFGIAMERTLTEATQGTDIDQYTERSYIDFSNKSVSDRFNIINSFATGLAQYPYQILLRKNDCNFSPVKDVSKLSNDKILELWLRELINDGFNILIRDNSWLEFPAYQIIIPSMSEANILTDDDLRVYNTRVYVTDLLRNPEKIINEDCKYILGALGYFKGNVLLDNLNNIAAGIENKCIYGTGSLATRYIASLCNVFIGDYKSAFEKIDQMVKSENIKYLSKGSKLQLKAEWLYLSAFVELNDHKKVMDYLEELLDINLVKKIDSIYSNPKNVFINTFPKDLKVIIEHEETENSVFFEISDKLKKEMQKTYIDQSCIGNNINI